MVSFLCFSDKPLAREELTKGRYGPVYAEFLSEDHDKFRIGLSETPCREPACWAGSVLCCFCSQVATRKRVLNHVNPGSGWSDYKCCQGYYGSCCCLEPGSMGEETCPVPCLCLEVACCPGPAAAATSLVLRKEYKLGIDDDDVRLVRCNNCIFATSVVLSCLALCIDSEGLDCAADCAGVTSDVVFACLAGCMMGQAHHEMNYRESPALRAETSPPKEASMER
mmetsp:Transcript_22872/g.48654  ORF Transcript_22872/g.48654 Transcript_22872/m.48654 type:complete len:224 (+) Transcript_22872:59-730(+)